MNIINEILPDEVIKNIKKIQGGDAISQNVDSIKLRLIPFSSLGMKNGMLVGVKADQIITYYKNKESIVKNATVGIYESSFTKDNMYNAIVGLDIIEVENSEPSVV